MSPLLLLVLGLVFLLLLMIRTRTRTRRAGEPPLIDSWIPFLGKALEYRADSRKFLEENYRKHGDAFTVHLAGRYITFVMNPLLYPYVIKQDSQLDFHEFSDQISSFAFGYTPLSHCDIPGLEDEIQRGFQLLKGENLDSTLEAVSANLMQVLRQDHLGAGSWRTSNLYEFCDSIMFETIALTMFGKPPGASYRGDIQALREDFHKFDDMFPLLVARVPVRLLGKTKAIRDKFHKYFLPQRMKAWSNGMRFTQTRMELFDGCDSMKDTDKAAHHFAMMWASVANTIPAIFWNLYGVMSDPSAMAAIREEMRDVLGLSEDQVNRPDTDLTLTREQLDKLVCMESTISESLRLSTSSVTLRLATEDTKIQLDERRWFNVRKGDMVAMFPQTLHMDPEVYGDPETYKFDRFVKDGKKKTDFYKGGQKLKYFLLPFGYGSSRCPGQYMATYLMKLLLCVLLLHFDFLVDPGQSTPPLDTSRAGLGTLPPSSDISFRYRLRTRPPH
ncbi:hypothetical protein JOB18_042686 [Solea senegalensis]|uniref:25-hydroxycholesterol 7-alpha-hydroxylase n=1 Tax=Solea senegalensis TaxID=28829 RepID=A0AAV6PKS2_SOLSE|nr:cytochrome P450 7B1 [Solea senegalensis]KAG7465461.1 25-hydroxycholesterol 7-alpha-hydroxylase [Solea senegalensis]KAG7465462.1 hypothetical protein JOB18_042686 [Solea senegalensis]KAG7465463.1 hypothetical protein JOB18_042686 [Solea senegalensis]KAG7465464.1 hypothetical protein JOB18_042686 [Solea senegalensis]